MDKLSLVFMALVPCAAACGSSVVSGGSGGKGTGAGPGATTTAVASSGAGGGCTTDADCGCLLNCCGGQCVNEANDIRNCGGCGKTCSGASPYCFNGTCSTPPCNLDAGACGVGGTCCETTCCPEGQLCCAVNVAVTFTKCQAPTAAGTCDIGEPCTQCASPDTPVATPDGERPIASLVAGDLVYSVEDAAVVAVPILKASRTQVHNHHVVEVSLESGVVLRVSPRHPTADRRAFADLAEGDWLGEAQVAGVRRVPYEGEYTYDILPASKTGAYYAGGALIGSTLAR